MHKWLQTLQPFTRINNIVTILIVFHQKDFHEVIEISIENSLGIRRLMARTEVLDHLVRMKHIASYLRAPLDLLLLSFELRLFLLTFLKFYVIKAGFQYSKRILSVVKLRTCLRILDHDARRNVPYTHTGLDLVHILSAGSARAICVPF